LVVIDEDKVLRIYWQPSEPRLKHQQLTEDLKQGEDIEGAELFDPRPILTVRTR
jgi:hypothetical protein